MSKEVETLLPISVLLRRFEKHRDYYTDLAANLPWWAWKRRRVFRSCSAVYHEEFNVLLKLGGTTVMHHLGLTKPKV